MLRAYGQDLEWWRNLTDDDRYEYLAADRWRQDRIKQLQKVFEDRIHEGKSIEATPYFALLQAELE